LYRQVPGTEEFQAFDSFSFAREGIKVTGGRGTLFKTLWRGKAAGFALAAENLTYEYEPTDTKFAGLYRKLKKDHALDVVFPEHGIELAYDNWDPKEVTFSVFGLDKFRLRPFYEGVYSYYSQETLNQKGISAYDLERRDDADARDYDLVGLKGTVELGLDDAE